MVWGLTLWSNSSSSIQTTGQNFNKKIQLLVIRKDRYFIKPLSIQIQTKTARFTYIFHIGRKPWITIAQIIEQG